MRDYNKVLWNDLEKTSRGLKKFRGFFGEDCLSFDDLATLDTVVYILQKLRSRRGACPICYWFHDGIQQLGGASWITAACFFAWANFLEWDDEVAHPTNFTSVVLFFEMWFEKNALLCLPPMWKQQNPCRLLTYESKWPWGSERESSKHSSEGDKINMPLKVWTWGRNESLHERNLGKLVIVYHYFNFKTIYFFGIMAKFASLSSFILNLQISCCDHRWKLAIKNDGI